MTSRRRAGGSSSSPAKIARALCRRSRLLAALSETRTACGAWSRSTANAEPGSTATPRSLAAATNCEVRQGGGRRAVSGRIDLIDGDVIQARIGSVAGEKALYRLLEETVVPLYYDRGPDGVPSGWLRVVRRAIETVVPAFSARRSKAVARYTAIVAEGKSASDPSETRHLDAS